MGTEILSEDEIGHCPDCRAGAKSRLSGSGSAEGQMQLRDVMNRNVESVTPNTPLREAAQRMSALKSGILVVCDNRKVVGLITPAT